MSQHTVKIKHKVFPYNVEQEGIKPDGTTGKIVVERLARRGEEVEVGEFDFQRGTRLGAFYAEGEQPSGGGEEVLDLETASVSQLADWIRSDKPTINEVIEASDGDPNIAQKLLDAENLATGNQPRSGLVDGLAKVIAQGGE